MSEVVPTNEEQADELLNSIEQPTLETGQTVVEPVATQAQELAFTVGGKEIKIDLAKDRDKLIRWAQQGYEAPNKLGEYNKKIQTYEKQISEWKTKEALIKEYQEKYEPVDKYIKENPQWWNTVQAQLQQAQNQNKPIDPIVNQLIEKVTGLEKIAQTYQERAQAQQMQTEDAEYMKEFEAVAKQYPEIDLQTPDEQGESLEFKVLRYAQENGIKKFTTAFRDFNHDKLVSLAEQKAKEKIMNDKVSKTKLGILGISSTPTPRKSETVRNKSYNDLANEALAELGLT